jgi:hypothetical protein
LELIRVLPRLFWIVMTLIVGTITSLVLLVVWFVNGMVNGVEICPHTFQKREFSYWQPTFFSKGWSKTEHPRDEFSFALGTTGTMPVQTNHRWDLVSDNHTNVWSLDLEARFLSDLLERRTAEGNFYWVEWSTAHVEQAKRFWPLVSRLAVDRWYVLIPELFDLASGLPSDLAAREFEGQLLQIVLRELTALREEAVAGGSESEVKKIDQALKDYELYLQRTLAAPSNLP